MRGAKNGSGIAAQLGARVRRLAYGATIEKMWRVASVRVGDHTSPIDALAEAAKADWDVPPLPAGTTFLADGFFAADGSILCEAMDSASAKGRLVRLDGAAAEFLTEAGRVWSYPHPLGEWIVPETAAWSAPAAYRAGKGKLAKAFDLSFERPERLLDPSLLAHDSHIYLFANRADDGAGVLRLWVASALDARFVEHPASPIRRSGRGSRMAGRVMEWGGGLFRLGQDWREQYGDGLIAFRITALGPNAYAEEEAGAFAFDHVRGPHTLDRHEGRLLFDYYVERFSWRAGWRRLKNRLP